jgi:hypothetical protein
MTLIHAIYMGSKCYRKKFSGLVRIRIRLSPKYPQTFSLSWENLAKSKRLNNFFTVTTADRRKFIFGRL